RPLWQLHKKQVVLRNITSFTKAQAIQAFAIIALIDSIQQRITQMGQLMDSLVHHDGVPKISVESSASPHNTQDHREPRNDQSSNNIGVSPVSVGDLQEKPHIRRGASCSSQDDSTVAVEGPSSLSAHSTFAVDFLHRAANSDRENGLHFDTRGLLESLGQIVDVIQKQTRFSETECVPNARRHERVDSGTTMPQMDVTAAVIRHGHGMY
ncbi:unnamed protein product, partial [Clonostachys byssicola]